MPPTLDETVTEQIVRLLVEAAQPTRIILFGSYARGEQTRDSDLDLLVIEKEVTVRAGEMVRLRRALTPIHLPMDILVYSEHDVENPARWLGTAVYDVLQEGRQLYAAE